MRDAKMSDYKVGYKKPPLETRWKPGKEGGPGRPPLKLFRELIKEYYTANPDKKRQIIRNLDELATDKRWNSQKMRAIETILLNHDGPQASEIHLKGVIAHIGDEYARLGIEANRKELEERKNKLLDEPSTT